MPFDPFDLIFELFALWRRLKRTGQHGVVKLAIDATLPDGSDMQVELPSITI